VESFDSEEEAAARRERLLQEAQSSATVTVTEALDSYAACRLARNSTRWFSSYFVMGDGGFPGVAGPVDAVG
jgi:hypothetical protein